MVPIEVPGKRQGDDNQPRQSFFSRLSKLFTSGVDDGKAPAPPPKTLDRLIQSLPERREEAVNELVRIGEPAVTSLIRASNTCDMLLSGWIVDALARIGAPAVTNLIMGLKDESENVRSNSALALGNMGKTASDAMPVLRVVADGDESKTVRTNAKLAISSISK